MLKTLKNMILHMSGKSLYSLSLESISGNQQLLSEFKDWLVVNYLIY
jgi:hypothetical protein